MVRIRHRLQSLKVNLSPRHIREDAKRYFLQFKQTESILTKYLPDPRSSMRILDVGCGKDFPHTLLYSLAGQKAVGIDMELNIAHLSFSQESLKRLIWSVRRKILQRYLRSHISEATFRGKPALVQGSIASLPFEDNTFCAAVSVGVWEHVMDVKAAAREISRVVIPGGIIKADAHLYTSISGSHHPCLSYPPLTSIPPGIAPWYHLRGPKAPTYEWLNRIRLHEYQEIFHPFFEELEMITYKEGEEFLSAEIREELSDYSIEELTTRAFQFIGRNRK